jgi:hypothetical protein
MIVGGIVASGEDGRVGAAVALGGLGINLGGAIVMGTAPDHLSRAVWDYNRSFAGESTGPGD